MSLTPEQIKRLQAPFEPDEHEVREKGTNRDKTKTLWLTYIEEGPVIERLSEVDPSWSLEITRVHQSADYVATYGRLTVCGVSREGVGTNSPNKSGDTVGEDEEKGAATDMLKRLARLFGVGLYLKGAPTIYTDVNLKPWDGKADAMKQYTKWHNERFGMGKQRKELGTGDQPRRIPTPEHPKPVTTEDMTNEFNALGGQPELTLTQTSEEVTADAQELYKWAAKLYNLSDKAVKKHLGVNSYTEWAAQGKHLGDAKNHIMNAMKNADKVKA